jgi:hypothetical protein
MPGVIKTALIGAVEYTISAEETGVVNARYISSGSMDMDEGVVCRGRAVGDTSNGFPGDYHIQYFDVKGQLAAEYDWHIEPAGDCFRLTWRARPETNPLPVEAGGVTFEGFGFPNGERSIVVAYWMSAGVSAALESRMSPPSAPGQVPVEDVLAVQDLLGRYCWYVDENRGADWAALYTEDGVFEGTRPEPVTGRAALAQVPAGLHAHFEGRMRHQWGNLYLERGDDDNHLIARFYNQISVWRDGGSLMMLAVSTASLVRSDAAAPWRIKRNSIVTLS